jgi:hypothetical protein
VSGRVEKRTDDGPWRRYLSRAAGSTTLSLAIVPRQKRLVQSLVDGKDRGLYEDPVVSF